MVYESATSMLKNCHLCDQYDQPHNDVARHLLGGIWLGFAWKTWRVTWSFCPVISNRENISAKKGRTGGK